LARNLRRHPLRAVVRQLVAQVSATILATTRGTAQWKAASVRKILLGQDAANLRPALASSSSAGE